MKLSVCSQYEGLILLTGVTAPKKIISEDSTNI